MNALLFLIRKEKTMKPIQIDVKTSLQPITFRNELGEELTLVTPLSIEQFISLQGDAQNLTDSLKGVDSLMEELGKEGDAKALAPMLKVCREVTENLTTSIFGKNSFDKFFEFFRYDSICAFVSITKLLQYMSKPEMVELVGEKMKDLEAEASKLQPIQAMENDKELEKQFETLKEIYGEEKILKMFDRPKK